MKKLFVLTVGIILCQFAFGQDRFIYNSGGKLNYIVSDTLKNQQQLLGDLFVESEKTEIGSHVQYITAKTFVIKDGEMKHIGTIYEPCVFKRKISKKSLRSLITWLYHVKENYGTKDLSTNYTYAFTDESRDLVITVSKPYNWWYLTCENESFKIEFLDSFIPNLEELESILENKQNDFIL